MITSHLLGPHPTSSDDAQFEHTVEEHQLNSVNLSYQRVERVHYKVHYSSQIIQKEEEIIYFVIQKSFLGYLVFEDIYSHDVT